MSEDEEVNENEEKYDEGKNIGRLLYSHSRENESAKQKRKCKIIGIAVGVIIAIAIAIGFVLVCFFVLRKKDSQDTVDSCLTANDCWVQYNFLHDDIYYDCSEGKYIRLLDNYQAYVGVKVCGERRYQIFLSRDGITGMFINVGDTYGYGEDHCEFLGGAMNGTDHGVPYKFYESIEGFMRRDWGQNISYEQYMRPCDNDECLPPRPWIVPWIKCPDVNIPGVNNIVQMDGHYPPTDRECYLSATPVEEFSTLRHNSTPKTAIDTKKPFVFWCSTDQAIESEVHVLSMSSSSVIRLYNGTDTGNDFPVPFHVTIKAPASGKEHYPVKLILASHTAVGWNITVEQGVNINQIHVVSNYNSTTAKLTREGMAYKPPMDYHEYYYGYGEANPRHFKDYVEKNFGPITSFIGRFSPTGYSLRVGI